MIKLKPDSSLALAPLADGQLWRMADANLQVSMVGKLLVHYKLGKPDAIRTPNSCNSIKSIEKYLKANKAVLDLAQCAVTSPTVFQTSPGPSARAQ